MKPFSVIVAFDDMHGIGKKNALPWHLSADLKHFKRVTCAVLDPHKRNAVIMGRNTWESLPEKARPLPGRLNIVLSGKKDLILPSGVLQCTSLAQALKCGENNLEIERVFVIGGAYVYTQAILEPGCSQILATHIQGDFNCDVYFPAIPSSLKKVFEGPWTVEGGLTYRFIEFKL